jgi:RNA polymerase sigma-70 factor (ECF subfamily)
MNGRDSQSVKQTGDPTAGKSVVIKDKTDQQLLSEINAGNRDALAQLYDRHVAYMLGLAYRILENRDDAEDLVCDVFLEAWQHANSYDPKRGSVRTWLLLRVRSRAIDRMRALTMARKHAQLQYKTDEGVASGRDDPDQMSDRARACKALASLSKVQRIVIELAYFEGLTCREIADRCNLPVGTVKSRLSAAMGKLRQQFNKVEGAG